MKKLFILFLILSMWSMGAQEIRKIPDEEALEALSSLRMEALNVLENYFYFLQGVDPARTSGQLDESMALGEHHLLVLEQYVLDHPVFHKDFNGISAYWINIRNKCVHTPTKGLEKKLLEHYNMLSEAVKKWTKKLRPSPADTGDPAKLFPDYAERIHYLSLLFVLYERTSDPMFKTIMEARLAMFNVWNNKFWTALFKNPNLKNKKQWTEIASRIRRFREIIRHKQTAPETVYTEAFDITEKMESMLSGQT